MAFNTRTFLGLSILVAGLAAACSSSDDSSSAPPPMCNQNPWSCPAGQTCWSADSNSSSFQCFNSGAGDVGEGCIGIVGQPECKDGLFCSLVKDRPRVCTPFCDLTSTEHTCPAEYTCMKGLTPGGQIIQLCAPPAEVADAGPEASTEQDGGAEDGNTEDSSQGEDAIAETGELTETGTD